MVGEPEAGPRGERVVPIAKVVAHDFAAPLEKLHGRRSECTCVLHNEGQNSVGLAVTVHSVFGGLCGDCAVVWASGRTSHCRSLDNGGASHVSNDVGTCVRSMEARGVWAPVGGVGQRHSARSA